METFELYHLEYKYTFNFIENFRFMQSYGLKKQLLVLTIFSYLSKVTFLFFFFKLQLKLLKPKYAQQYSDQAYQDYNLFNYEAQSSF